MKFKSLQHSRAYENSFESAISAIPPLESMERCCEPWPGNAKKAEKDMVSLELRYPLLLLLVF